MQRRTEANGFTSTNTPGRTAIADEMRARDERVSVRDVVMAGGVRRFTVKEMFGEH